MSFPGIRIVYAALLTASLALPVGAATKHAPALSLKTQAGETKKLAELHGQIVVLNFWATWCGPCQEELPRLSKLSASYSGKPVKFIAVSIDDKKDFGKIPGKLQQAGAQLEVWVGADSDTMDKFGLGDIVPGTVIIDGEGEIVARIMGEAHEDDVKTPVDWLLGGKTGPAPQPMTKRY